MVLDTYTISYHIHYKGMCMVLDMVLIRFWFQNGAIIDLDGNSFQTPIKITILSHIKNHN